MMNSDGYYWTSRQRLGYYKVVRRCLDWLGASRLLLVVAMAVGAMSGCQSSGTTTPTDVIMKESNKTDRPNDEASYVQMARRHLAGLGVRDANRLPAPTIRGEGELLMLEFPERNLGEGVYGPDFAYRVWINRSTHTVVKVLSGG